MTRPSRINPMPSSRGVGQGGEATMTEHNRFCPLCDVSLDLHDGPNTCDTAAQKEFIIALPFVLNGPPR